MSLSANELLELKCETRFNVLLLLRNRYPEGLETYLMRKKYEKFFEKEINQYVFNPEASNPQWENKDFLGEDILICRRYGKMFYKAKHGCNDETMQFLSNSINSGYQDVKIQGPDVPIYDIEDENEENQTTMQVSAVYDEDVVEVEEVEPLQQQFADQDAYNEGTVELAPSIPYASLLNCAVPNANNSGNYIFGNNSTTYEILQADPVFSSGTSITKSQNVSQENNSGFVLLESMQSVPKAKQPKEETNTHHRWSKRRKQTFTCTKHLETPEKISHHNKTSISHLNLNTNKRAKSIYKCNWEGCGKEYNKNEDLHEHAKVHQPRPCLMALARATSCVPNEAFKCSVPNCLFKVRTLDRLQIHERRCRFKFETLEQMELEEQEENLRNCNAVNQAGSKSDSIMFGESVYVDLSSVKAESDEAW